SLTMPEATADGPTLRRWAARSLRDIDLDHRLRLMGVKVEGLQAPGLDVAAGPLAVQENLPLF
ncbi:MAG: hypothetical protein RLZZ182_2629, partial [Pseudomonadota bacterium]